MAFAGIRGTGSFGQDERPKNFREAILFMNPNGSAPLFALTSKARKEKVNDPEFAWFEEYLDQVRVQVSGAYATSVETFTLLVDGLKLVPGDVLLAEKAVTTGIYDHEIMEVSTVTNDTTVVLKRAQANTTRAALVDLQYLLKIGSVFQEGSAKATVTNRNPVKVRNYTQIFKTAISQTGTSLETKYRTGDAWANDKKRRAFDHSRDIEMAMLYGKAYEDTTGAQPKRFTAGLRSFYVTNVTAFTTTPTIDTFMNAIQGCFDWDSSAGDERIGFCGNGFMMGLNKLVRSAPGSSVQFNEVIKLYGMKLNEYILPMGRIAFKSHPLMNRNSRYTYSCFIVDPTMLKYRPLRDTKFEDQIQTPGQDAREAQWLTEMGVELEFEKTGGYIENFLVP
jgi:hypothetical protein